MFIDFEEYHPFTITAVNFDEDEKLTWNDEYQRLWIDTDRNKKFQIDAIGDCCSCSVIIQWEDYRFEKMIGKTIKSIDEIEVPNYFDVEIDDEDMDDLVAIPHLYEFTFTDDTTFKFLLVNYSNGYYDGWINLTPVDK